MVNEDVLTALKNGIERGESLQDAINLAISSGYNPKDIEEASRFVGQGGYLPVMQAKPSEELSMPSQKNLITGEIKTTPSQLQKVPEVKNNNQIQISQIKQEISKPIQQPVLIQQTTMTKKDSQMQVQPLVQETTPTEVKPSSGYGKEILLLFILLLLVGVLIGTFLFKEQILNFFSTL